MGFKRHWQTHIEKNLEYFEGDLFPPFRNWEDDRLPEMDAVRKLRNGLICAYARWDGRRRDSFFDQSIAIVERALAENKFMSESCQFAFPGNRACALRVRAYASALLGRGLLIDDLNQSSIDYESWCEGYEAGDWDSQAQAYYLDAVRTALLAGELNRASGLLDVRRSFRWHQQEFETMGQLIRAAVKSTPVLGDSARESILTFFELIRDPSFQPDVFLEIDVVRLEWGALVNKYLAPGDAINWNTVIEIVSN